MESLLEALYAYAQENLFAFYSLPDEKERQENETMVRLALDELKTQGMGDAANRVMDGLSTLSALDRRSLFLAGLSMGMKLNQL